MHNLIHLAIPGFLLLLLIEVIAAAWMHQDLFEWKDTVASLTMGIGNVVIGLFTKVLLFASYSFVHRFAIFHIGYQWWAWVLLFFAEDFTYYVFHRTSHECRFFWASHVVHHSSQHYNLGTALRQTWTGGISFSFIFWLWLPLIGFAPIMVMTMQAISLLYQFWIHTELIRSLGPLEAFFNTPSHHRVHHASNLRYLDRNHAGTLIIWDRVFRTFEPEDEAEPLVYGLTKNINTYNPVRIAFHEWIDIARDLRSARNRNEIWHFVFGRPGWKYERQVADNSSPLAESAD
jgi:sterol desaturase/sphingolipid hydroxylase (fatty acid hydroxylase superfamily)